MKWSIRKKVFLLFTAFADTADYLYQEVAPSMKERFGLDTHRAVFFEDTPKNLEPAKAMGMRTVLIGDGHGKPLGPHIDYQAPELLDFLLTLSFKDVAA